MGIDWELAVAEGDWSKCTSQCNDWVYVSCWGDSDYYLGIALLLFKDIKKSAFLYDGPTDC